MHIKLTGKLLFQVIVMLSLGLFFTNCTRDQFESPQPENVSFKNDLIPLFNNSCNSIGCHNNGGIYPDLSEENAYDEITGRGLIDDEFPENSLLYRRMIDNETPMPIAGLLLEYQSQQVLVWIQEGHLNN